MLRRTKIVVTLGPSSDKPGVLEDLFKAGIDVVRLNFSHGTAADHIKRANAVCQMSAKTKRYVGIIADLQGPKIRISSFKDNKVWLDKGQNFALDINLDAVAGDKTQVGITYKPMVKEVKTGDCLLIDDGRIILRVVSVVSTRINCTVLMGGYISNNKGINLQGGGLSAKALTDKDKADIKVIAKMDVDYVAVSFPRTADDLHEARSLLEAEGCYAGVISKIERSEAIKAMDQIILASDVVMVARGDLGVEIGDSNLPAVQKKLISRSRELKRAVIIATQMMESMIENSIPTRAEVFDVANAVHDGTDAVMLSAETASGNYPVEAVKSMSRVCKETEKQSSVRLSNHRLYSEFGRIDEAIAMSAMYLANHSKIDGIVALTESGSTTLWMSRVSSGIPILALSYHKKTLNRVTIYRGVFPVYFPRKYIDCANVNGKIIEALKKYNLTKINSTFIITKGDFTGVIGGTNVLKVVKFNEDNDLQK